LSQDTVLDPWVGKESSWAFQRLFTTAETHEFTHGIHQYPAKLVPQIARALIGKFSERGQVVLDPFCGSGTVLVESSIAGRSSIGVEINPLAILISRVSTTPIDETKLRKAVDSLNKKIHQTEAPEVPSETIGVHNINHWFKPDVINSLYKIRTEILREEDEDIRNLFLVTFSATMHKVSNIRHKDNPYFARVLHEDELSKHKPDTLREFRHRLKQNVDSVLSYSRRRDSSVSAEVIRGDSRNLSNLIHRSIDMVVTSPPYGEQANTMDYTRFTRLATEWLQINNDSAQFALGASNDHPDLKEFHSPTLEQTLALVGAKDEQRAEQVATFLRDYQTCLRQIHSNLKRGGFLCVIIGDRTASGIDIPNGIITSEIAGHLGFETTEIVKRKMFLKALLSNVMKYENVVILRKS
jgi:DNA modification methylase